MHVPVLAPDAVVPPPQVSAAAVAPVVHAVAGRVALAAIRTPPRRAVIVSAPLIPATMALARLPPVAQPAPPVQEAAEAAEEVEAPVALEVLVEPAALAVEVGEVEEVEKSKNLCVIRQNLYCIRENLQYNIVFVLYSAIVGFPQPIACLCTQL